MPRGLKKGLAQEEPPELVLPLIVEFLVMAATFQPELARLVWVCVLEFKPDIDFFYRLQLEPIFQAINVYIQRCDASGTLRSPDSSLTTVAVVATIVAHQEMHLLLSGKIQPYTTTEDAVAAYSRFWLDALNPTGTANRFPQRVRPHDES